jgi:hypothetical protein
MRKPDGIHYDSKRDWEAEQYRNWRYGHLPEIGSFLFVGGLMALAVWIIRLIVGAL